MSACTHCTHSDNTTGGVCHMLLLSVLCNADSFTALFSATFPNVMIFLICVIDASVCTVSKKCMSCDPKRLTLNFLLLFFKSPSFLAPLLS